MAQPYSRRTRAAPSPIDRERLSALALAYVARYATSRAKLASYLRRKLAAAGWADDGEPPVEAVVERCAALGYLDDAAFATARGAALGRRGLGPRRVAQALRAAGIAGEDAAAADAQAREAALASALTFARRRRIGPFAETPADRDGRQRQFAAMLRAGHAMDLARAVVRAEPGAHVELP